jgi:hypothetical protein
MGQAGVSAGGTNALFAEKNILPGKMNDACSRKYVLHFFL